MDMNEIQTALIASATSKADLIKKAEIADPKLAASLTSKSLIGSKSVWAPPATAIVSWAATRYGIALDPDTSSLISGLMAWVAIAVCRYLTRSPIGGVVTSGETPSPAGR